MNIRDAVEWFEDNEDEYIRAIEELDSWNGYLDGERYYEMYLFDELMSGLSPTEIVEKLSGDFNIMDDYFRFTDYGVESSDYLDYSGYLDVWFVKALIEERDHLYLSDEVERILDEVEREEAA